MRTMTQPEPRTKLNPEELHRLGRNHPAHERALSLILQAAGELRAVDADHGDDCQCKFCIDGFTANFSGVAWQLEWAAGILDPELYPPPLNNQPIRNEPQAEGRKALLSPFYKDAA